jgi:small multidrug resistance pump
MDKKQFASLTLKAAAIYNIVWGSWVILRPNDMFELADMPLPNYPSLWQCVGMIVGVYGVGYWIAATHPWRHWPIVFVGLLGKILGPIGFVDALMNGVYDIRFGYIILTNDLIWWVPFGFILWNSYKEREV